MPSSVNINGKTVYTPGVYGDVDASALGGKTVTTGNLAIVGQFPSLQHDTPTWFEDPSDLIDYDPNDVVLRRLGAIAFSPSNQDDVGGANRLCLVNCKTNTQAGYTFPDGSANESVIFMSKRWGLKGNQVFVKLAANATDSALLDVFLSAGGKTESYTGLGTGAVASFLTSCPEIILANQDTAAISLLGTALTWTWRKLLTAASGVVYTGVLNPGGLNKLLVNGKVKVKMLAASAENDTCAVSVVGLDKDGAAKTATVSLAHLAGGAGAWILNEEFTLKTGLVETEFSRLDSITWTGGGGYATAPALLGYAFNALDLTQFTSVQEMLEYINNYTAAGWTATADQPQVAAIPATDLDLVQAGSTLGAAKQATANVWGLLKGLEGSSLVTAARGVPTNPKPYNGMTMPLPSGLGGQSVSVFLLGGGETPVVVTTDYPDALTVLETEDVQVVVGMDTSVDMGSALVTHCKEAALKGSERNAYYGCVASQTRATIYADYVVPINSRHVSVNGQQIDRTNPVTGKTETLDPPYFAVLLAAIQCGTPVGEPLTNKTINVKAIRQSWTPITHDDDVISKGICAATKDSLGYKVLRSVTTYVADANEAFSEISANESINYSIRDLRAFLLPKVGRPANMSPSQLKGVVERRLTQQVKDGRITAWRNVLIKRVGSKYSIDYDVAPIFPANFFYVKAHVFAE